MSEVPDSAPNHPEIGTSARILIVEDNPVNRRVVELMLESFDLRFDVAVHGQEGVDRARQVSYALILMDLRMPYLDGLEAARRIRQHDCASARTPIYALTAFTSDEDRAACFEAGMDGFLAKPVSLRELRNVLEEQSIPFKCGVTGASTAGVH